MVSWQKMNIITYKEGFAMPFIESKIANRITPEQKEAVKTALGKAVSTLNKSENFLMVGIEDGYDLWMAGEKLEKGAYVSVSLFGNAPSSAYSKLTAQICEIFEQELAIPAKSVYITYHPISDWGWNGSNF